MCDKLALEKEWLDISCRWGGNPVLAANWMDDLCSRYEQEGRHYHTLNHIVQVLTQANVCREKLNSWESVFFATWFHDAIQQVGRDNEGESAALARRALMELLVPEDIIACTEALIMATKHHDGVNANDDAAYFIDCDLSMLAKKTIYQTDFFRSKYEEQARLNIARELDSLKAG